MAAVASEKSAVPLVPGWSPSSVSCVPLFQQAPDAQALLPHASGTFHRTLILLSGLLLPFAPTPCPWLLNICLLLQFPDPQTGTFAFLLSFELVLQLEMIGLLDSLMCIQFFCCTSDCLAPLSNL